MIDLALRCIYNKAKKTKKFFKIQNKRKRRGNYVHHIVCMYKHTRLKTRGLYINHQSLILIYNCSFHTGRAPSLALLHCIA